MSILDRRDYYKPFQFPWAYESYRTSQALHWLPHESPMADDCSDWEHKLTADEREFLTQIFRFFTQADIDVASGYVEKYMPRFPAPELRMMMSVIAAAEANHIDAYSTLMETLGISEGEYKAFMNVEAMKKKHEYMFDRESGKSIADLIVDISVFSGFGEGMQLFASFALLMTFQRRGLMKGMSTIIEWSIRDESHHVESMLKVQEALITDHPRAWNPETKERIAQAGRDMVAIEDAFIDAACGTFNIPGFTPDDAKLYIRFIADRRCLQMGIEPIFKQKTNPFSWLDEIMNLTTHTNFFEGRSTEYSKREIEGWDVAFEALEQGAFA